MGMVRLRVKFEDADILSKLHKSEGLKRSWLLLRPHHRTISDVSSFLIDAFELNHACPSGIVLSMDGFVLPPFESVGLLKDKDKISVKKKTEYMKSNIIKAGEPELQPVIWNKDSMDKQLEPAAVPLLEKEEFEKEAGGYESDSEEESNMDEDTFHVMNTVQDEVSKKRKAAKSLQSARKKRKYKTTAEDFETNKHCENDKVQTDISKDEACKESICLGSKSKEKTSKRPENVNHPGENGIVTKKGHDLPDSTKKVSRSARRKYAKRKFLKELREAGKIVMTERSILSKNEEQSREKEMQKSPTDCESFETDKQKNPTDCQSLAIEKETNPIECHKPDWNSEIDGAIVPIVIRPGHIRFEPLDKDHIVQDIQIPLETFQWNGLTSKKRGQMWGKEKFAAKRVAKGLSNGSSPAKESQLEGPMDFEKLAPLLTLPRNGDVIAYRLLELSSTWIPVVSSFRVGKTLRSNAESNVVLLAPVSDYPIVEKKADDVDVSEQPDGSLYNEDGSLEIEFSSLIDVRIFKSDNDDPVKAVNESNDLDWSTLINAKAATSDKKETNLWDELSGALSAKKSGWDSSNTTIRSKGTHWGSSNTTNTQPSSKVTHWGSNTSGKNSWSAFTCDTSNTINTRQSSKVTNRGSSTTSGKNSWSAFTCSAPSRPYCNFTNRRK